MRRFTVWALALASGVAVALPMRGENRAAAMAVFQAAAVQPVPCDDRQGSSPVIAALCGRTALEYAAFRASVDRLLADHDRFQTYKAWESRLGYASISFFRRSDRARRLYTLFYSTGRGESPPGAVVLNVLAL
jgi:hypothetical protein